MAHDVIWTQPPPLWPEVGLKYAPEHIAAFRKPAILRFSKDDFMEDYMDVLATEPERLSEFKARPETWRGFTPPPEPKKRKPPSAVLRHLRIAPRRKVNGSARKEEPKQEQAAETPLKLYQPANQRHYLVSSSLVCRVPGLPDREVNAGREERAGFVMRRLLPPKDDLEAQVADWVEHAWVPGRHVSAWRSIKDEAGAEVTDGEEVLPMFGVSVDERGRKRRKVFGGVIPVGKREAYLAGPSANDQENPGSTSRTARKVLLRKEVIEPWKGLVSRASRSSLGQVLPDNDAPDDEELIAPRRTERGDIQLVSWLILLDFARYLSIYLKPVWEAIGDEQRADDLGGAERSVFEALRDTRIGNTLRTEIRFDDFPNDELYRESAVVPSLLEALKKYTAPDGGVNPDLAENLESRVEPYQRNDRTSRDLWPQFLFPLADPVRPAQAPLPPSNLDVEESDDISVAPNATNRRLARIDKLAALIVRALGDPDGAPEPDVPAAAIAPADALEGWFRIRCVYERPACEPLHGAVVSEPTEPFLLAGYFDPDAPARPIRIGLPIDTTPAGLRKFDKNTALVISNTLCGQVQRMKGLTFGDLVRSVLPWPLHKDLPVSETGPCKSGGGLDIGMICTLSIPIITLCALFMLMIMVTLLDIIFKWIPWFILCFPIPGLKGKK